ncbi:MAG TPA: maleylpyruvate isomerase N-terminal domain-containing protein [Dehalococcoidia bacterium]
MDAATIRAQVEDDRTEWARLQGLLDAHPDGPLHDPEVPDWTSRDVYTHLAHMMEWTAKEIERVAAGEPKRSTDTGVSEDDWNARLRERYQHMSLEEARKWANDAFEFRERPIESAPLERWDEELVEVASHDGADHFRGHLSYLVVD